MTPRTLTLSPAEREELEGIRDTDPKPYRRERAAALLKIADGMPAVTVAKNGLLKRRHPETILIWINHYQNTRIVPYQPARRARLSPPHNTTRADIAPDATKPRSVRD